MRKPRLPVFNDLPEVRSWNGEVGGKILKIHQMSEVGVCTQCLFTPLTTEFMQSELVVQRTVLLPVNKTKRHS